MCTARRSAAMIRWGGYCRIVWPIACWALRCWLPCVVRAAFPRVWHPDIFFTRPILGPIPGRKCGSLRVCGCPSTTVHGATAPAIRAIPFGAGFSAGELTPDSLPKSRLAISRDGEAHRRRSVGFAWSAFAATGSNTPCTRCPTGLSSGATCSISRLSAQSEPEARCTQPDAGLAGAGIPRQKSAGSPRCRHIDRGPRSVYGRILRRFVGRAGAFETIVTGGFELRCLGHAGPVRGIALGEQRDLSALDFIRHALHCRGDVGEQALLLLGVEQAE